jgi:hypothetical protein
MIPLDPASTTAAVLGSIRHAADRLASELCAAVYEGDAPAVYHAYVEEQAYQAMVDGLKSAEVDELAEFGHDQELEDRAALDREQRLLG